MPSPACLAQVSAEPFAGSLERARNVASRLLSILIRWVITPRLGSRPSSRAGGVVSAGVAADCVTAGATFTVTTPNMVDETACHSSPRTRSAGIAASAHARGRTSHGLQARQRHTPGTVRKCHRPQRACHRPRGCRRPLPDLHRRRARRDAPQTTLAPVAGYPGACQGKKRVAPRLGERLATVPTRRGRRELQSGCASTFRTRETERRPSVGPLAVSYGFTRRRSEHSARDSAPLESRRRASHVERLHGPSVVSYP